MFRDFSKLGIVCLNTRLEGDLKKALSHLLLAGALALEVPEVSEVYLSPLAPGNSTGPESI